MSARKDKKKPAVDTAFADCNLWYSVLTTEKQRWPASVSLPSSRGGLSRAPSFPHVHPHAEDGEPPRPRPKTAVPKKRRISYQEMLLRDAGQAPFGSYVVRTIRP